MIRFTVELPEDRFRQLQRLATDERRPTKNQARWLLERALSESPVDEEKLAEHCEKGMAVV